MSRKVKGAYTSSSGSPAIPNLRLTFAVTNEVSAVFDHVRHVHCQVCADDVAPRPFSSPWFTPVVAQLVVDESVVRERSHQSLRIEAVGCPDIGRNRCEGKARAFGGREDVGIKNRFQSRLADVALIMTDGPWPRPLHFAK